jgi:GNAT superfamily N-acetyltransferase
LRLSLDLWAVSAAVALATVERAVNHMEDRQFPISVRKATDADADALFGLAAEFATSFVPERAAFEIALADIITTDGANLSVAEVNSEVIGYCLGFDHYTFYANGRVAWVEEITVKETVRRKGVGKALMENFEEWSSNRGSRLVALATRRASSFYRSIEYEESATFFRKLL